MKCRHKPDFSVDLSGQSFHFKINEYKVKILKVREILGWLSIDSPHTPLKRWFSDA